jgi:antitoxin ParD1/3/4
MKYRLISIDKDSRSIQKRDARLASLEVSIARGVADADAGRVRSISEAFGALELKLKAKLDRR